MELIAGRYEIVRQLGRGGMGEVLLARQVNLNRLVVVKRVVDEHSARELQALADEARIAARLHHPNIVSILDVIDLGNEPIVVMELIVGVSLRDLIQHFDRGMPVELALPIAIDLLRGLAYAHSVASGDRIGIVHRDVKPRNVMVTFAGVTKLIDFGISRWLGGDSVDATSISGTRGYMPPEQQRGERVDGRADQYAVGVTLREMLTGEPVRDEGDALSPPRPIASRELAAIVDKAAAERADARYASCTDMLTAVEAYVASARIATSTMHVERWMSERFADRKQDLELDAAAVSQARDRSPTAPTIAARGSASKRPDADDDAARMERIGALSVELYHRYRELLWAYYATSLPDSVQLADAARTLVAADPEWAHAYALLVLLEGKTTDAARRTIDAARTHANEARDPSGVKLINVYELVANGNHDAAFEILVALTQADRTDLQAATELVLNAVALHRTDEATAMSRRLHAAHPELQFGADLADSSRRAGRDAEAERVIRDWVAEAPDNVVARVELVRIDARAGRLAEASAHAREALATHGERDDALPDLYEALIASEQIAEARQIADRMLVGSSLTRARGRYRVAVVAVFEGRFAAAYDSIRRAIDEHRVFGHQSELVQCLEFARAIAPLVADAATQHRYTSELADAFATYVGDPGSVAALRYELALIDRRGNPSIDDHLVGLADGPVRDVARRRMLRAAAVAECGAPHKAVAAGFSAFEENTASLVALGLCAWRIQEIELARRSFERASQLWSSMISTQNSPYHAVLARFHLAGVLAELGEVAASRNLYDAFLRCWGDADRPVPEVAIARRMLEQK